MDTNIPIALYYQVDSDRKLARIAFEKLASEKGNGEYVTVADDDLSLAIKTTEAFAQNMFGLECTVGVDEHHAPPAIEIPELVIERIPKPGSEPKLPAELAPYFEAVEYNGRMRLL